MVLELGGGAEVEGHVGGKNGADDQLANLLQQAYHSVIRICLMAEDQGWGYIFLLEGDDAKVARCADDMFWCEPEAGDSHNGQGQNDDTHKT